MAALDRYNVCSALQSLFEADDDTLYGQNKLLNKISIRYTEFEKAYVDVGTPYKMYMKGASKETVETRAQNKDYTITVDYRVVGYTKDPETAQQNIDDIDERLEYLCSNEMWAGNYLTDYFTNTESEVIDVDWVSSTCDITLDNDRFHVTSEGKILVTINRQTP